MCKQNLTIDHQGPSPLAIQPGLRYSNTFNNADAYTVNLLSHNMEQCLWVCVRIGQKDT